MYHVTCHTHLAGWKMERQMDTLHCSVLPSHSMESANQFVQDLKAAIKEVKVSYKLISSQF